MLGKVIKSILFCTLIFSLSLPVGAQPIDEGQMSRKDKPLSGPRRQMATIIFAGLGGAVLGLSTLSFYGRPQDKLSNIAIGFALGVITGTVLVTYKAASEPQEVYGSTKYEFNFPDNQNLASQLESLPPPAPTMTLQWSF